MNLEHLTAYKLIQSRDLPGIQSKGYLLRHLKSGARIMLIENEDDNKVFNIAFRTPPADSTGVPHIMEHSVLCGSRKFPAKDPFVELAKGSMNTFLNAMTFPDKTMYPVASCNDADFANLMDVYLDAVFFPNIYQREEIFRQEGWHYEVEKEEDPICYNGVVYNEMKGAFSSPDDVVQREIMNSLFPDTPYGVESGGVPECIPELTYEAFLDFHRKYYHPSNSYIYLYGDMDFEERLAWLDQEYLSRFDAISVDSQIALQEPFREMRRIGKRFPIAAGEDEAQQAYLCLNAVIGTSLDTRLASAFAVLDYALLSSPGAVLRQALIDAGLGKDVMGSYDSETLQPVFSIIVKGSDADKEEAFLKTVKETLEQLAEEGLDQKALLGAINLMDFKFREADFGTYPKGLMYGIDVFDSWLYDDGHPFDYLDQLEDFAWLREQVGKGYFEGLIREYLLDNPHKTLLVALPEKGLTAKTEEQTAKKLKELKDTLSREQLQEMIRQTGALHAYQEAPSTKEELETIPMLGREDLKKTIRPFRNECHFADGAWIVHHEYATNGIAYLDLLFDASCVTAEELPYLSFLRNLLGVVDTEHFTYMDLVNDININTGGITVGLSQFRGQYRMEDVKLALGVQIRTLYDKIGYSFDMVREILFTSNLRQEKRVLEILKRQVSRLGTRLGETGNSTAATRAMAAFSPVYAMNDAFGGVEYYDFLRTLEANYEERRAELMDRLEEILHRILSRPAFLISYTGDGEQLGVIRENASKLMAVLTKDAGICAGQTDDAASASAEKPLDVLRVYPQMRMENHNEGLKTSSKVQYVARAGSFTSAGFTFTGTLRVLRTILSYEYLWGNVRVVGGAYGCGSNFLRSGETYFVSYRDPQLRRTNEIYDGIPEFIESFEADERDMTKYVIGTVSDLDTPLTPSTLGTRSMDLFLSEGDPEMIQAERDQVLQAQVEDIRALASLVRAVLNQQYLCVLGNEDRIQEEAEMFEHTREL